MKAIVRTAWAVLTMAAALLEGQSATPDALPHSLDEFVLKQPALGKDWRNLPKLVPPQKAQWNLSGKPNVYRCFGEMRFADCRVLDITAVSDGNDITHFWVSLEPADQAGRSSVEASISKAFGEPVLQQPVELTEPKVERKCWISADRKSAVSMEILTNADDLGSDRPTKMGLHVYKVGDAETFFFDSALFMLSQGEIEERMHLVAGSGAYSWGGLVSGLAVPVKFFGMDAQLRASFILGRPMAVQLYFHDESQMPVMGLRIVSSTTTSPFTNSMKELISVRTRSTPSSSFQGSARNQVDGATGEVSRSPDASSTLRTYEVGSRSGSSSVNRTRSVFASGSTAMVSGQGGSSPRSGGNGSQVPISSLSGSTSAGASLGSSTLRAASVDHSRALWSPRGWAGNYMLDRRYLTAFPPGYEIAKSLDPNIGSLMGHQSLERATGAPPSNIFKASYLDASDFKSTVTRHPLGGVYIPVPSTGANVNSFAAQAARILQHYGLMVDGNRLARLAKDSEAAGEGRMLAQVMEKIGFETKERRPTEEILPFVRTSINLGMPVLWRDGAEFKIINGYDDATKSIIYTSSSIREAFGSRTEVAKLAMNGGAPFMVAIYPRELKSLR